MFKKKFNTEVVSPSEYTDFSARLKEEGNKYATKKTVIAALLPLAVTVPIVVNRLSNTNAAIQTSIPVTSSVPVPVTPPVIEPTLNVLAQTPSYIPVNTTSEVIQTGFIADKSLEGIANVMEPLIQILVAVSFPVASVIMVGACFFFMFGNSDKAWSMIMNAGLGYVLIQMSPLFLNMLRTVGEAV